MPMLMSCLVPRGVSPSPHTFPREGGLLQQQDVESRVGQVIGGGRARGPAPTTITSAVSACCPLGTLWLISFPAWKLGGLCARESLHEASSPDSLGLPDADTKPALNSLVATDLCAVFLAKLNGLDRPVNGDQTTGQLRHCNRVQPDASIVRASGSRATRRGPIRPDTRTRPDWSTPPRHHRHRPHHVLQIGDPERLPGRVRVLQYDEPPARPGHLQHLLQRGR